MVFPWRPSRQRAISPPRPLISLRTWTIRPLSISPERSKPGIGPPLTAEPARRLRVRRSLARRPRRIPSDPALNVIHESLAAGGRSAMPPSLSSGHFSHSRLPGKTAARLLEQRRYAKRRRLRYRLIERFYLVKPCSNLPFAFFQNEQLQRLWDANGISIAARLNWRFTDSAMRHPQGRKRRSRTRRRLKHILAPNRCPTEGAS